MIKDFPFTTYDFYAYLASGIVFLFSADFILTGGMIFSQTSWSFVESTVAVASAYIVGQIIAIPSSIILEHFLLGIVFRRPMQILMSPKPIRWHERVLSVLVGRYYSPFPESIQKKILTKASHILGKPDTEILENIESLFQPAYAVARQNEDVRNRMDDFRNQYGFARNISFVGLLLLVMAFWQHMTWPSLIILLTCVAAGMFLRFAKFYASFSAELLRTFAFAQENKIQSHESK